MNLLKTVCLAVLVIAWGSLIAAFWFPSMIWVFAGGILFSNIPDAIEFFRKKASND